MVNTDELADQILRLLEDNVQSKYRISVVIVGPPGSGKSTIAEGVCKRINNLYQSHLKEIDRVMKINEGPLDIDLTASINDISEDLLNELEVNNSIFPDDVENKNFEPVKYIPTTGELSKTIIYGRGGVSNSIELSPHNLERIESINLAEVVPMDGFHLSRNCLDKFKDPARAHRRRGSPATFDSNNFATLCKILSESSKIEPPYVNSNDLWEKLAGSVYDNIPDIHIPGFDHALKDPTINKHTVSKFTRILIYEGLYLLYDKENWKSIYPILSETGAALFYRIDVPENVLEDRVAKRHVESGLVDSLESGIKKFQENDLINAREIAKHSIVADNINIIENL